MSQTFDTAQLHLFDLKDRQVLVLGLGDSGVAMARWAARQGARVRVVDTRSADGTDLPQLQALRAQAGGIEYAAGPTWSERWLDGIDLLAWSPGLSIERGESARFHALARERGVTVAGELELFAQALADLRESGYRPKVIAVTGTNGKTTAAALAAHLCRGAGLAAVAAGNIGPAMLDALAAAIDADTLPQAWVLELSSFQLALSQGFAPDAATILNVSEDHLDWHATMDSYVAAKQRIYGPGTIAVFDRGDAATAPRRAAAAALARGSNVAARDAELQAQRPARRAGDVRAAGDAGGLRTGTPAPIGFGADAPPAAGDFGLIRDGTLAWLAQAVAEDEVPAGRRRREPAAFTVRRLMPADALRIRGLHNQLNALAALALCSAIGVPMAKMLHALRDYAGEPHRCQLLAVIDGVEYYDDSKGTNVGATIAALRGLGRRCRLIAGGDGKGQDFAPLAAPVREHAAAVYLIGRDAPLLRAALQAAPVPLVDCASLEEAVARAAADARSGEAVLLSPACASLDMFRNYAHRAEVFAQAVRGIADARGVVTEARC
ncbi:MAG: UDP-N-acetylmuramoyl-L-alanine--D-glutamate ligase [Burkholderiaceae bacterium]|nr:UDP-N-acetylmuramoyl-L-alanine--D-glutamate ligase [Burkholderiaceae bacterium]